MNAFTQPAPAQWFLIQTKPRQEARAEEHLLRQRFECYRPLQPNNEARRGAEPALFPGYLFIRMAAQDNWYPIRSTRGVTRVVSFGTAPCPVPDALVEQIRLRLAKPCAPVSFVQGEAVRVKAGTSELQAIFLCDDGQERAVILLNLLQRQQRVSLPKQQLARLVAHAC
ncbi:transcription/translation regulatory transformer protein RfaH [Pseudomonas typographi]|uniref:transcription/translation regulatory transformer protein RfaH n=1 Tax=Pseudomonas typographi TaxID=2715964 RepID=UPI001683B794|nr:transcription/translation regulatory transformer protein RfaH [Pseudomonas typographi]MBD1552155.1 transcription/translation regulatory transformer protein RfaH [Pseudomonas typographi]MBD1585127.1 transcription/translation regulatory transformer protein RfaH [Pseudomonas typographi]